MCYLVLQSLLEWNGIEVLVRCASVLIHYVDVVSVAGDTFLGLMGEALLRVSSDNVLLVSGLAKETVRGVDKKLWRNERNK